MKEKTYDKRPDIIFREVAGENLLVPIRGDLADMRRIFSINAVGGCVWELLDGQRSMKRIVEAVCDRFDAPDPDQVKADVLAFVSGLLEAQLAFEVD
ncbi:MAG: PqqD family protein [Desulfobacterales bacterium]|nr:PqqD family protein [Desulfobacterales bacterium]